MRISDWSSDVCSSDLLLTPRVELADELAEHPLHFAVCGNDDRVGAFVARDDGGIAGRDAAAAPGAGRGRGGRGGSGRRRAAAIRGWGRGRRRRQAGLLRRFATAPHKLLTRRTRRFGTALFEP